MRSDVNSCTRYFLILLIVFLVALYQIHTFNKEVYAPMFYNSSDNF